MIVSQTGLGSMTRLFGVNASRVTVRHLATMRSGVPDYDTAKFRTSQKESRFCRTPSVACFPENASRTDRNPGMRHSQSHVRRPYPLPATDEFRRTAYASPVRAQKARMKKKNE